MSFRNLILMGCLVALAVTNPRGPDHYVSEVSRLTHSRWCRQSQNEWCEILSPITRPMLPWTLKPATQTRSYVILTVFHTRLPCLDIFGVGIAGQHIIWPMPDTQTGRCQF
ncbi:MAG: hypothetical protein AAGD09_19140 [Cyanobacteria bacterium P01_F01_bin.56]